MPSASEVQVAHYIDSFTGNSPNSIRLMLEGILTGLSTALSLTQNPVFFSELVRQTYNGYYTTPEILRLIGTDGRPPQPLGYELEKGNLELLKKVQDRGQIWRDV